MGIRLVDSHCHLEYEGSAKPENQLVQEALDQGVVYLMNVGVDLPSLEKVQASSERYPQVFHTVGVHPHEAQSMTSDSIEVLRKAARHPKCKAIGEIGLDYYYDNSPREIQRQQLQAQLDLAAELGLPVVIHTRDAEEDQLKALQEHVARLSPDAQKNPGVIHCFTGTQSFGQACIDLGFSISFSGILTFKTAEALRECARSFPLDRILVETDSPFLAPIPHRGKKCEPVMVIHTAQKIADVRGISLEELAEATFQNTCRVFGLPHSS